MLLCPLMYYGSSIEDDMDLCQFAIMFRAIFQEGMFRPGGSIKDFLDLLLAHYQALGGTIRTGAKVSEILRRNGRIDGVRLASGETIHCDCLLSTIGLDETLAKLGRSCQPGENGTTRFCRDHFSTPVIPLPGLAAGQDNYFL